ncbi:MAG: hypothetical protein JW809_08575 [Pirellulales bacterium]|nr:hypothetical protein [Pirellulales bacterium]
MKRAHPPENAGQVGPTLAGARVGAAPVVAPPEPRWMVLLMLFVLMGPLALPMLWHSPHFTRPWKIVLTVLVCLIAVAALCALAWIGAWFWEKCQAIRAQTRW